MVDCEPLWASSPSVTAQAACTPSPSTVNCQSAASPTTCAVEGRASCVAPHSTLSAPPRARAICAVGVTSSCVNANVPCTEARRTCREASCRTSACWAATWADSPCAASAVPARPAAPTMPATDMPRATADTAPNSMPEAFFFGVIFSHSPSLLRAVFGCRAVGGLLLRARRVAGSGGGLLPRAVGIGGRVARARVARVRVGAHPQVKV